MNDLVVYFFRFLVVSAVIFLLVGLFKPEWLRFRGKQPDVLTTIGVALALFMAGFTGVTRSVHTVAMPDSQESRDGLIISAANYPSDARNDCKRGSRAGPAGASDDEVSLDGVHFSVRTPSNYKASHAHPLLIVFAPAGRERDEAEAFMYLTKAATEAGFIIAYTDHLPVSPENVIKLAEIPKQIAEKWCVDMQRIFTTGHSDGGTTAMGIALFSGTKHIAAAIAPSAVGIRGADLADRNCPKPTSVMLMHSNRDKLFPDFGKESSTWWAKCNKCDVNTYDAETGNALPDTTPVASAPGCVAYSGCKNAVQTWYCEGSAPHPVWPGRNQEIIEFFKAVQTGPVTTH